MAAEEHAMPTPPPRIVDGIPFAEKRRPGTPERRTSQHTGMASIWFILGILAIFGAAASLVSLAAAGCFFVLGYLSLICSKLDHLRGRD